MLDDNDSTYLLLDGETKAFTIELPQAKAVNRVLLQEAITSHSERVEGHAVDAWVNGEWKEMARATNIGYKRILRFPDVTTSKIRVRVLESRLSPAISHVSTHYYRQRPPRLEATRDINGQLTLSPVQDTFNWANWTAPLDQRQKVGFPKGCAVHYTTDGSEPNEQSPLYTEPFTIENKELKAVAFLHGEKGAVYSQRFDFAKNGWKINGGSHAEHPATAAADENANTYWLSIAQEKQPSFTIDLGRTTTVSGIAYLPPQVPNVGMAAAGYVETRQDGKQWAKTEDFTFGNIVNNPTRRYQYFNHPIKEVRYIRFVITETAGSNQAVGAAEWEVF